MNIRDPYNILAKLLRTTPETLLAMDQKMLTITGQVGVLEDVVRANSVIVDRTLSELGMSRSNNAEEIYNALATRLIELDKNLFEVLGYPDLSTMSDSCGKLCETALKMFSPPRGLFIKRERVVGLLEKYKPEVLLSYFNYSGVAELVEREGFASVVSALRFTQDKEWMHTFFNKAYGELTPGDFEERDVELKILDTRWLKVAEKFMKKKFHNVSHLKEYGVIFIIPTPIYSPGETMRMFVLILHYLYEVPYYSNLFRESLDHPDFITRFQSLLRGDVPEGPMPKEGKIVWRVVQRYLTKDDPDDFRLKEPHVNPEANHYFRVAQDLSRLGRMLEYEQNKPHLGFWNGLDYVGDIFIDKKGQERLISFGLMDLIMSVVVDEPLKYVYHQQEALWNKIFAEYMGREKMTRLIEENLINGFIKFE